MARKKKLETVDVEPDFSKLSEEEKQFINDNVMPIEDIVMPPAEDVIGQWEDNGGAVNSEDILLQFGDNLKETFVPEDLRQVTTKIHAKIYDRPDLSGQRIHLTLPENFVVYAALVRESMKRTMFYQIAEGELFGKFIDKDEVESVLPLDN